jgi:uncharacterized phiE125 gp8 family phage protein
MALKDNALITLQELKDHIGIHNSVSADAKLEGIINASSAMIASHTKRVLTTASYEQIFDGAGANKVILHQWPVTSIIAVYVDGDSVFDMNSLIPSDDYRLEKDIMVSYITRVFPRGYSNIRVDYTAGYGTVSPAETGDIPSDLKWACSELASWFYNSTSNRRIGVVSKGKLGESVSYEQRLPQHVELLLEPYVRHEFAHANVQIKNV